MGKDTAAMLRALESSAVLPRTWVSMGCSLSSGYGYCACGEPYWTLRDRDATCCSRCRETKAPARQASLVAALEAKQRELPVSAFDRRAASEAWSAGVRAAVVRLEEEKRAADARRLGWGPELTGGDE